MRYRLAIAAMYAEAYTRIAGQAVVNSKDKIAEHKSELTTAAVTTFVVGTAAHVVGFKSGYKYAMASAATAV